MEKRIEFDIAFSGRTGELNLWISVTKSEEASKTRVMTAASLIESFEGV